VEIDYGASVSQARFRTDGGFQAEIAKFDEERQVVGEGRLDLTSIDPVCFRAYLPKGHVVVRGRHNAGVQ